MITTMKITKAKLKQIIKEEIESITNEARAPRNAIAFARQVQQTIEDKVGSLETKIDNKIDAVEESIVDCKLTIHDKLNEKFDTLISKLEK